MSYHKKPIEALFEASVENGESWNREGNNATAKKLFDVLNAYNVPNACRSAIGDILIDEAYAQCRAGFEAGFRTAVILLQNNEPQG